MLHQGLAIEELVRSNDESNRTMVSLVERVREETEARDRKVDALEKGHRQVRWVIVLAVILVLFLLTLGVINAINLTNTRATNQTLLDCVNATGACGQVNAESQTRILDTVKKYELTVLYCARTNPQPIDPKGDKFLACVDALYPGGPQLNRRNQ